MPHCWPAQGLILDLKATGDTECCQVTQGKYAKFLISNLYVVNAVALNWKNGLSYCPDGDFFLISLDESGLPPYSVAKWDSVVIYGFQGHAGGGIV